jgi:potassium-dependent mechanosensitive channel
MSWLTQNLRVELFTFAGSRVTPLSILGLLGILVATILVGRIVRRATSRLISRSDPARAGIGYAVGRIAQYIAVIVGLVIALENVGFNLGALAAVGAVIGVGIGLGLQGIAQNFVSGLILLIERPIERGDFLVVGDVVGRVRDISMRSTTILTRDGVSIIMPNSELVSTQVTNLTQPTIEYRSRVRVGVAYGSDTELVRDTLLQIANEHAKILAEPAPNVQFVDFGQSSLDFELLFWIDDPLSERITQSDLRFSIDAAFREKGVQIPFPQRDLHLRSAAPGLLAQPPSRAA